MNEKMIIYVRNSRKSKYHEERTVTDRTEIYEQLAADLLHKKIHKCTYIKSIVDINLYNGLRKICVYYDNNVMREYIVRD